jgi:hypothetical protein
MDRRAAEYAEFLWEFFALSRCFTAADFAVNSSEPPAVCEQIKIVLIMQIYQYESGVRNSISAQGYLLYQASLNSSSIWDAARTGLGLFWMVWF